MTHNVWRWKMTYNLQQFLKYSIVCVLMCNFLLLIRLQNKQKQNLIEFYIEFFMSFAMQHSKQHLSLYSNCINHPAMSIPFLGRRESHISNVHENFCVLAIRNRCTRWKIMKSRHMEYKCQVSIGWLIFWFLVIFVFW